MKSSFRSVHVALTVVGAIGLAAFANGCSAGPDGTEQTGETNQALIYRPPVLLNFTITSETTPPDIYAGDICLNYDIAVPPSLAGYDCTLGAEYALKTLTQKDPALSYAFACKAGIHPPAALGLTPPSAPYGFEETVTVTAVASNSCFGNAISGWVLVVDNFYVNLPPIGGGGCQNAGCARGGPQ